MYVRRPNEKRPIGIEVTRALRALARRRAARAKSARPSSMPRISYRKYPEVVWATWTTYRVPVRQPPSDCALVAIPCA
jgi:hypothetical protein